MILDCDLAQIEWRICADLSGDRIMCEDLHKGIDQHAATATSPDMMNLPLTKENRQDAKIFNFRAIYCNPKTGAFAYYMDPTMPNFSQKRWDTIVEGFFNKYSGLTSWHKALEKEVRKTGTIKGPLGHIWQFEKVLKKGGYKDYSVEKIYNYPVQGTSGAIIKLALITILNRSKHIKEKKFIMTVHDSLIWDVPETHVEELARINLEVFHDIPDLVKKYFGYQINVPISGEATAGPTWGDQSLEFTL